MKFSQQFPEITAIMSTKSDGNMKIYAENKNTQVIKNRKTFFSKHKIPEKKVYSAGLSHSANAKTVSPKSPFFFSNTDALITLIPGIFLSITVADCYPIIFYEPKNRIIGLAHVGWKGTKRGIIKNILSKMKKAGANPGDIFVSLGPGICQNHFEFDAVRAKKTFSKYKKYIKPGKSSKVFVDLAGIIISQLKEFGIKQKNIKYSRECTFCQDRRYFSSRRDKKQPIEAMIVLAGMK